ncbi:hypothetical protein [Candidatus Chloroploca asiatica]|uniref:Uncharacterized protein n=1 Tax=Candidatus Chloroploca asiatica TaxID=1506545 RepID=A0A2H3L2X9_9CHLR|nr:hypothetical protein [Candidatus Chloroploca asiatica]PDW00936.1 hypothetical protein A9Q02_21460 [Candidatus Chloroploca asiatica]
MFDTTARVWERAGEVIVAPPVPVRPFIDTLKTRCRSARASSFGWVIPADDAETAVALLRAHFPVVQDARQVAPQPPPFVDGGCDDPFRRLDLIAVLTPAAPALRAIYHDRHEARAAFAQLAAYDPTLPAQLGLAESLENQWVIAYAAQRFWHELLSGLAQLVHGVVLADGTVRETITAPDLMEYWHRTRRQICGAVPEHTGQRWYPTVATLPIWIAGLLACLEGPAFTLDESTATVFRHLPPWPLRLPSELFRLEVKDAVHWPVSVCVLPGSQVGDGQDVLLHLSAVGGLSKNRALWAAILDGRREPLAVRIGKQRHAPRRIEGRRPYVSDWNDQPLHASGLSHLALTHRSAFEPALGQAFVHLAGNDAAGAPDLVQFAQQLSRAISLPFDLAWAAQLWAYGTNPDDTETALITPLPSIGCQGYWVLADEPRWMRLIIAVQHGVAPEDLRDDDLMITDIGAALRLDDVIEQAGEGGDEGMRDEG